MTNLFSPFDLNVYSSAMLFVFLGAFFMMNSAFVLSYFLSFSNLIFSSLNKFFLSLKPFKFNKASSMFFFSLFYLLMISNFFSVFSYNFPLNSQVSLIFLFSLMIWINMMSFSGAKNFKGLLSHFIPEGAPIFLTLFLFLIEIISTLIRPLTLMVRLVANILAGHLLMILLSSLVFSSPFYMCFFLYLILNAIEMFVALIQAYIFTTMIILYFAEV